MFNNFVLFKSFLNNIDAHYALVFPISNNEAFLGIIYFYNKNEFRVWFNYDSVDQIKKEGEFNPKTWTSDTKTFKKITKEILEKLPIELKRKTIHSILNEAKYGTS